MGCYIAGSGNTVLEVGSYYVGDMIDPTDVEVPQRPHVVCTWNGSVWEYEIAATRAWQKARFCREMEADFSAAISDLNIGLVDLIAFTEGVQEVNFIAGTPSATAAQVPFLDGYSQLASITKAAAAALVDADAQNAMGVVGFFYAYKVETYAAIDSSSDYAAILAMNYVRPL